MPLAASGPFMSRGTQRPPGLAFAKNLVDQHFGEGYKGTSRLPGQGLRLTVSTRPPLARVGGLLLILSLASPIFYPWL